MIYYKIEGQNASPGLNIYKLTDPNSIGFIMKLGRWKFCVRYSKRIKRWFIWLKKEYYGY